MANFTSAPPVYFSSIDGQRLEEGDETRRLDLCRWVIANRRLIPFILITDESSFTLDVVNHTHNSHRWSDKNQHAIVVRNSQYRFSVNVWCGVIDNQLIGPSVLPNRLTGRAYVDFLQKELPLLFEEVPLAKRCVWSSSMTEPLHIMAVW